MMAKVQKTTVTTKDTKGSSTLIMKSPNLKTNYQETDDYEVITKIAFKN